MKQKMVKNSLWTLGKILILAQAILLGALGDLTGRRIQERRDICVRIAD